MRFFLTVTLLLFAIISHADDRLTFAEKADTDEFQWIAQVKTGELLFSFSGTAIQINDEWLVTAGHVLDGNVSCLRIRYGNTGDKDEVTIESYVIHPGYLSGQRNSHCPARPLTDDIALMKLSKPVPLKHYPELDTTGFTHNEIRPETIVHKIQNDRYFIRATMAGYGHSDHSQLYKVSARCYAGDCINSGNSKVQLYETFFDGIAEHGDSGGALFNSSEPPVLYGVLTDIVYYPDVNKTTSVAVKSIYRHLDFIQHHTGMNLTADFDESSQNQTFGALVEVTCPRDAIISGLVLGIVFVFLVTTIVSSAVAYKCFGSKGSLPSTLPAERLIPLLPR